MLEFTHIFLSFLKLLLVIVKDVTAKQSLAKRVGNMIWVR